MKTIMQRQPLKLLCFLILIASMAGLALRTTANDNNNATALSQPQVASQPLTRTNEWKDPEKVLPEVVYDALPITEVAEDLKKRFEGGFDLLLPFGAPDQGFQWDNTPIKLRLKNVRASEVFNAMNLVFETAKTPLRWELMMNGHRPTALLRDLYEPIGGFDPVTGLPMSTKPAPVEKPMVFFVGDLVGDPKSGGMTMDTIIETVIQICHSADVKVVNLSGHIQAQLLIVRGTEEDIRFVQTTLAALRDKNRLDAQLAADAWHENQAKVAEPKSAKSETDETKAR
jgi:hypothetical protein